ncbi:Hypothetical protein CINCED_3A008709 [Cinara cedri]|uniref:Uncharacterized protein n=1 Tax=Cinara cedri TaxID=506608 RepID=A0A5E4N9E7_9HEMI|nr:Hypothetical protein CINCED_3A008709 [Cinara cedri]
MAELSGAETESFFSASAKKTAVLRKYVGNQLISLCEMRWAERHEGVKSLMQDMHTIIDAILEPWKDLNTFGKAKPL